MIELNARVTGSGEPLLLLHGLFGSLENLGVITRLLSPYYEIHALDLRNHGRSPHTEQMSYQLMADDIYHYMEGKHIPAARVLGHSMGGKTAMTLALQRPERVRQLVVADIAPVTYTPHHDRILDGLSRIDPGAVKSRQEADNILAPFVPEIPVRQFLLKNLVKSAAGHFQWRMNLQAIIRHYQAILQGQQAEHPYLGAVLFLKGGVSDYIKAAYQSHTASLFPAAQLKIIPSAGHWLHVEKPELFSRLVLRFFNPEIN
jgi:esterase